MTVEELLLILLEAPRDAEVVVETADYGSMNVLARREIHINKAAVADEDFFKEVRLS